MRALLSKLATDLGREVAASVENYPSNWSTGDGYYLCRDDRRIDIWIASQAYGLRLTVWPIRPGLPRELRPSWADRHLIWNAVKRRREPTPEQFKRSEALAALIH
jgi:hypothetical protein